jgi:hypothetical protein
MILQFMEIRTHVIGPCKLNELSCQLTCNQWGHNGVTQLMTDETLRFDYVHILAILAINLCFEQNQLKLNDMICQF